MVVRPGSLLHEDMDKIISTRAPSTGGTGSRLSTVVIILAGVAALSATVLTFVSVWLQTKNYRKPLLQRYVVRILCMVPIYSAASWVSLVSLRAAFWISPLRDVYEAFTIYAFFQLLINFIGGERSLIIMMHGRKPVSHPWPLGSCLPKIDISDPYTFLAIKRGILQYTWMKPILALATIIMKATGTYQEGYIGLTSGYLWSGIIYNVSITISLYALAMFWVIMSEDLQPFRPMPKFLCIKGIIFASYWQGFFLSILVWLGAIPSDVPQYTPDNLAAAIQDGLICFEMPIFALLHWYAFSWHDYADATISAARMPVKHALRDAFGPRDLIEDAKETFGGTKYGYRHFDAEDDVLAHEDSAQRAARMMEGMRYERGGKGKYWIPRPGQPDSKTPLLGKAGHSGRGAGGNGTSREYGAASDIIEEAITLDEDDERLFSNARALEFGDWNYPVITAHEATSEHRNRAEPDIVTASTNRNVFQPTAKNKRRRKSKIQDIQDSADKGKHRDRSGSDRASDSKSRPLLGSGPLKRQSSSDSAKSDASQLVDLVIEDHEAEDYERVRARKEGGAAWNESDPRFFVKTYPDGRQAEEVREGYEPDEGSTMHSHQQHALDDPFALAADEDVPEDGVAREEHWRSRDHTQGESAYQGLDPEPNVWDSPKQR